MKKTIITALLLVIVMAVIPIAMLNRLSEPEAGAEATKPQSQTESKAPSKAEKQSFLVLDEATGGVEEIPDREFCVGALAAEMPPSFEKEALKAQTVALYTHFSRLREEERKNPDETLGGADFKVNSEKKQGYLPKDQMKEQWKDTFAPGTRCATDTFPP